MKFLFMKVFDPKIKTNSALNPIENSFGLEAFFTFTLLALVWLFNSTSETTDFATFLDKSKNNTVITKKFVVNSPAVSRVTFIAVGDIMLSRGVDRAIKREANPLLPFSQLRELLISTDFNFGNLESPVSGNDRVVGRGLIFNTDTKNIVGLRDFNFKIVNLANNHALDQGLKGLIFTQNFLDQQEIQYLGVGANKSQAWNPKIITANGIKIGFIGAAYSSINDGGATTNGFVARVEELGYLKAAIDELKVQSDFIVVTMHAGIEYTRKPNKEQILFARTAVDLGADLVIGSHPHWIQTFENYRGKYIFYSLGNFIFDQRKPDTKEGLVLLITIRRSVFEDASCRTEAEKIELIPVINENLGAPRRANFIETKMILDKIRAEKTIIFPTQSK